MHQSRASWAQQDRAPFQLGGPNVDLNAYLAATTELSTFSSVTSDCNHLRCPMAGTKKTVFTARV